MQNLVRIDKRSLALIESGRSDYPTAVVEVKSALQKRLAKAFTNRFTIIVVNAGKDSTYRLVDNLNPPQTLEESAKNAFHYLVHNPQASKSEVMAIIQEGQGEEYRQQKLEDVFERAAETYYAVRDNKRLADQITKGSTKQEFIDWTHAKLTQGEPAISMREIAALACKMLALPESADQAERFNQTDLQSLGHNLAIDLSYLTDNKKKESLKKILIKTLRDLALAKITREGTALAENFPAEKVELARIFMAYVKKNMTTLKAFMDAETTIIVDGTNTVVCMQINHGANV